MIRMSGIGTYLRGLLSDLQTTGFFETHKVQCSGGDPEFLSPIKAAQKAFSSSIYSVHEQFAYPGQLSECRLWHAPHYNIPLFKGRTRLVTTVHDLIHWIYRRQFFNRIQTAYAGFMLSQTVKQSDHIIAVSRHTRADLIRHFGADPSKISVIHEAADPSMSRITDSGKIAAVRAKFGIPASYFLYVGLIKPHKNLLWLKKIICELRTKKRLSAGLVIAGKKGTRYPKGYEALARLEDGQNILHIEGATREELTALYSGALALVHPSLYEGFGLTILEAMACQTPVIALDTASIPEVAGNAACLIRPGDDRGMGEALQKIESDPDYARQLAIKGKERAAQFSWKKTAEETAALYERLLHA